MTALFFAYLGIMMAIFLFLCFSIPFITSFYASHYFGLSSGFEFAFLFVFFIGLEAWLLNAIGESFGEEISYFFSFFPDSEYYFWRWFCQSVEYKASYYEVSDIHKWCDAHCKRAWAVESMPGGMIFYFLSGNDAMFFRLTWC